MRLSNMFRSPNIETETMASPPVHVLPTCWKATPEPMVQVVTALRASTSPGREATSVLRVFSRIAGAHIV